MDYNKTITEGDSIVKKTIDEFIQRSEIGKKKYGTTLDRTDLCDMDYIQHAKEEAMDMVLYLNKFLSMKQKE